MNIGTQLENKMNPAPVQPAQPAAVPQTAPAPASPAAPKAPEPGAGIKRTQTILKQIRPKVDMNGAGSPK